MGTVAVSDLPRNNQAVLVDQDHRAKAEDWNIDLLLMHQQTPVSGALPVHPIRLGNVACPVSRLISKFERKTSRRPVLKQSESQTLATSLAPAVYPFHNPVPNTTSTHLGVVRKACLPTTEPEVTATT